MKTVIEILQEAKKLLIEREWTQGAAARDLDGNEVSLDSNAARSFCALGAIGASSLLGNLRALAVDLLRDTMSIMGYRCRSIAEFNDTPGRTKEEVLALFDEAIAETNQ